MYLFDGSVVETCIFWSTGTHPQWWPPVWPGAIVCFRSSNIRHPHPASQPLQGWSNPGLCPSSTYPLRIFPLPQWNSWWLVFIPSALPGRLSTLLRELPAKPPHPSSFVGFRLIWVSSDGCFCLDSSRGHHCLHNDTSLSVYQRISPIETFGRILNYY